MSIQVYGDGSCAYPSCQRRIPEGFLMCRDHWRLVPQALQNEVWRELRRYQRGGALGPLRDAQDAAVRAIS